MVQMQLSSKPVTQTQFFSVNVALKVKDDSIFEITLVVFCPALCEIRCSILFMIPELLMYLE